MSVFKGHIYLPSVSRGQVIKVMYAKIVKHSNSTQWNKTSFPVPIPRPVEKFPLRWSSHTSGSGITVGFWAPTLVQHASWLSVGSKVDWENNGQLSYNLPLRHLPIRREKTISKMDRKGHKAVIMETRKNEKDTNQIKRNSYQRMSWGLKEWLFSILCVCLLSEVLSGSNHQTIN